MDVGEAAAVLEFVVYSKQSSTSLCYLRVLFILGETGWFSIVSFRYFILLFLGWTAGDEGALGRFGKGQYWWSW